MRHRVMYGNSADHNSPDQCFRLHEDAIEFAENMLKQHRFVWLLECGRYRNRGGRRLTCWIYYWWSPAVTKTDWGECPDAGWGRPQGRRSLVKYEPLLYREGSKYAHLNVRASPTRNGAEAPSSQTNQILKSSQQLRALVDSDREAATRQPGA
jgi:hypothetical protein